MCLCFSTRWGDDATRQLGNERMSSSWPHRVGHRVCAFSASICFCCCCCCFSLESLVGSFWFSTCRCCRRYLPLPLRHPFPFLFSVLCLSGRLLDAWIQPFFHKHTHTYTHTHMHKFCIFIIDNLCTGFCAGAQTLNSSSVLWAFCVPFAPPCPKRALVSVVSAYAAYCVVVFSCCCYFERVELCERKVA